MESPPQNGGLSITSCFKELATPPAKETAYVKFQINITYINNILIL